MYFFLVFYYLRYVNTLLCSISLQFSLQDNGSAKYFQGAMHTPNMGEKVAQVSEIFLYREQLISGQCASRIWRKSCKGDR